MVAEDDTRRAAQLVAGAAEPLPDFDDPAFGALFDRFADARVVCLGEASHGTSEFYRARAAITRHLIERHGFTMVAVEADWPDAAVIDRTVRAKPAPAEAPTPFTRFPAWMWRNAEFDGFVDWLTAHNADRDASARVSFHGLDLYNMTASVAAVIGYLERVDPAAAAEARRLYGCLKPWKEQPERYGRMALSEGHGRCETAVVQLLRDLFANEAAYAPGDPDSFLDAAQNARLVANAEAYYRAMYYGSAASWNLRDEHMADTLELLLQRKGPDAKAVVWAHNSHVGDARRTDMGQSRGELNLGQLVRERYDGAACLIGFGTHAGTVAAADDWDEPMRIMTVNPSRPDSFERILHDSGAPRFLLDLREGAASPELREALAGERLERYIGVIYRPDTERWSHYSEASLAQEYDAFLWFDTTTAVQATAARGEAGQDETWPTGL
ncbi:erythromycin esterase family protein [Sphingomonas sp. ACRSK]|uniref:erythromycin esterase family protein n=1 Tax=Sphingomonas sp. ACRSK TaxID=2918213 RepID=UPI001EF6A992|nr:erythromycin esterase family protein [Sphingomonas sp. ACRSK]MCG7347590.1 erythromycin esterase family protein [Sphingomonas sp. ACRSK]